MAAQLSLDKFFDPRTPSMRKGRDGEKKTENEKKNEMENNGENSGPLTSLQVDRLTATDCNAGAHAKKPLAPGLHLGVFILILYLQNQCIFSVFLIKLTKFGCLLCLNGGSYGPENYFFWSSCGWTSG